MKKIIITIELLFTLVYSTRAQVSFEKNGQQIPDIYGWYAALGDFNGDSTLDVVFGPGDSLYIYFGDDRGEFTDSKQKLSISALDLSDVNDDGQLDIVGGKTIWLNDGKGNFTSKTGITGNISSIKLADLNGDGYPDIFAIVDYNASRVFFNDGAGNFTDSGQKLGDGTIGTGQAAEIALGDINNDGAIDAITAGWRWDGSTQCPNQVWINDGKGNFTIDNQNLDEGSSHVHGLTLFDLNGDGWLDLILTIQDGTRSGRIYMNDQTGNLIKQKNIGGCCGEDVELGDFNGDGITDLFIAQSQQKSRVWLNDGEGNLTDGSVRLGNNCYWEAAVGDFNNDGKPDVFAVGFIWSSGNNAPVDIWLNTTVFPAGVKTGYNSTPSDFKLYQNYPNPFNPATTISYFLSESASIKLKIYDILGREIITLVDSFQSAGKHSVEWDTKDDNNSFISSGIYFYRLEAKKHCIQKKMVLLR